MPNTPDRFPVVVLGRTIGTVTGVDMDMDGAVFYDFNPAPNFSLDMHNCENLTINYADGWAEVYSDDGVLIHYEDLLHLLNTIPQNPKIP